MEYGLVNCPSRLWRLSFGQKQELVIVELVSELVVGVSWIKGDSRMCQSLIDG
jgi:hypothetical protein